MYSRLVCAFGVSLAVLSSAGVRGAETINEQITFETNVTPTVKAAKIQATLHLPARSGPVPAMIIMSSSGGVIDWIEGYYARGLNNAGIAALVVDSFQPRGVKAIIEDQTLVSSWDMENDAFAALKILRNDKRIDSEHIGIMGVSKGGIVAQNSAFMLRQKWRGTGDLAFAAHVSIVPSCGTQHRDVSSTGRPILYMLAELHDYNSAQFCKDYAERIRKAGNANVEVKVYKGAHHNWEMMGAVRLLAKAENYSACKGFQEENGAITMAVAQGPTLLKTADVFDWWRRHCMTIGAHVGGGTEKLRREATNDLIQFLKKQGF